MMGNVKPGNYIVINDYMVNDLKLKGNELLIYAIIYGFSQEENQTFNGSQQYLADWTNSTRQSVVNNLNSLIEKGFIKKEETVFNGVKFVSYYATKFNRGGKENLQGVKNFDSGCKKSLQGGCKKSLHNNLLIDNIADNIDIISSNDVNFKNEFAVLWKAYPKKLGKKQAFDVYVKARKNGVEFQTVQDGIKAYCEYISRNKISMQFVKQGCTWFRGECWNDDYDTVSTTEQPGQRDSSLDDIF